MQNKEFCVSPTSRWYASQTHILVKWMASQNLGVIMLMFHTPSISYNIVRHTGQMDGRCMRMTILIFIHRPYHTTAASHNGQRDARYVRMIILMFHKPAISYNFVGHTGQMDRWYVRMTMLMFHTLAISYNSRLTQWPKGRPVCENDNTHGS